jgi:hypothetical protein
MSDSPDFAVAWNDYRHRRRWFFGVWLGGFLAIALLVGLLSKLSPDDVVFYILGLTWMIAFIVVAIRLQFFKCPRCHHKFFGSAGYSNPLARKCLHCGLPKWSESDLHEKQVV